VNFSLSASGTAAEVKAQIRRQAEAPGHDERSQRLLKAMAKEIIGELGSPSPDALVFAAGSLEVTINVTNPAKKARVRRRR
jgi:hypothetical protein